MDSTLQRVHEILGRLRRYAFTPFDENLETCDLQGVVSETTNLIYDHLILNSIKLEVIPFASGQVKLPREDLMQILFIVLTDTIEFIVAPSGKWIQVKINEFPTEMVIEFFFNGQKMNSALSNRIERALAASSPESEHLGLGLYVADILAKKISLRLK